MKIHQIASQIIQKIEHLEHSFNFYFTGNEKKPPLVELERVRKEVDSLMKSGSESKNSAERFLVLQLVNRFTTYRMKWEKGVRDIEEGRAKQGLHFFGGLGIGRSPLNDLKESLSEIDKKDRQAFRMSSVIDEAAEKYIEMTKKYTGKNYSRESVSQMLEKKIEEVRKKFGDRFRFNVYYEDGKVKIRPEKE
jgi:hypothetical protein